MYYILLRKKGIKRYLGAIPVRRNTHKTRIKSIIKKYLSKGYNCKIVNTDVMRMYKKRYRS